MALTVIDTDGTFHQFPTATLWHIDDADNLHLSAGSRVTTRDQRPTPVATFSRGSWCAVQTADPKE